MTSPQPKVRAPQNCVELGSLQATALEAAAKDREEHEPKADDEQDDGDEADALPPPRRTR